jgi:hypothetical protein
MPEPGELRRPVAPVVDRQPEVDDEDEDRAKRRGLREELQRVGAPAPGEHEQQRETEEDAQGHNRRTAGRMHATDYGGQQSGNSPSRPALNTIRPWAFTPAISTPSVEVNPAR